MEETTVSSSSPCSPNETGIGSRDCVEENLEWLDDEVVSGFRVWQIAGIVLSILLSILIGFCCCIRFRVPRTKQEIEADYIRKKITKSFRKELSKFSDDEMDDMDLRKALDRIRNEFDEAGIREKSEQPEEETIDKSNLHGFRSRVNAVLSGIRIRFSRRKHSGVDTVI